MINERWGSGRSCRYRVYHKNLHICQLISKCHINHIISIIKRSGIKQYRILEYAQRGNQNPAPFLMAPALSLAKMAPSSSFFFFYYYYYYYDYDYYRYNEGDHKYRYYYDKFLIYYYYYYFYYYYYYNNHGKNSTNDCQVISCYPGHERKNGQCTQCTLGFYKSGFDAGECSPCFPIPSNCKYVSQINTSPMVCFRSLL